MPLSYCKAQSYRAAATMFIALLCACATIDADTRHDNAVDTKRMLRFIVAFNVANEDPESPNIMQLLTSQLNSKVVFLKKISGNAAVYATDYNDSEFSATIKSLENFDEIKYAEPDQLRKINFSSSPADNE